MKMRSGFDAWKIQAATFPACGSEAEKLEFLVNYAVLAPSKYNAQPWLFELGGDSLDLICDRNWAFRTTDPRSRELIISCGAALLNLRLAARYFGYTALVDTFPWPADRYLLARVRLSRAPAGDRDPHRRGEGVPGASDEALFEAMPKRRTFLGAFWNGAPPDEVLAACGAAALREGAWLHWAKDSWQRHHLAGLIAQAGRLQMADRAFRREMAQWIHPVRASSKDGVPGRSYGLSGPLNVLTPGLPLLVKTLDLGAVIGLHRRELAERAPVLAVLGTNEDTPPAWLAAGQALEAVLLQATAAGLATSFFNEPIEVEALRSELRQLIGRAEFPQVLLRLGYGRPTRPMPRRPADEVVI